MKLTNSHGLPAALVRAVAADDYDKGEADFSATELLKPPQIRALSIQHRDEIVEDASDRIWSLLGKVAHHILEQHSPPGTIVEERLFRTITVDGRDYVVSGAMDVQWEEEASEWVINDWKLTSVGTVMYGDQPKPEWEQQLNIYQWLRDLPTRLQITAIFRDFKKSQVGKTWRGAKRTHPERAVEVIPIESWDLDKVEEFIADRIREHVAEPRRCTSAETWKGVRCADWCEVSQFCPQYQEKIFPAESE